MVRLLLIGLFYVSEIRIRLVRSVNSTIFGTLLFPARFQLDLSSMSWDVVVITETWRADTSEYFVMNDGHFFYGSGGTRGSCGIGFLINNRWTKHCCDTINNRLALLELALSSSVCLVIAGVYMPHAKHASQLILGHRARTSGASTVLEGKRRMTAEPRWRRLCITVPAS